jgi:F0F1-type ATP synthase epsilon subunit
MAMTMHIDIVSAEAEIFSGTVEVVVAPAIMGEVGIYPRHTQMLTPLKQAIKDRDSEMELAEAQAKLAEAVAQLQAIQRMKKTSR